MNKSCTIVGNDFQMALGQEIRVFQSVEELGKDSVNAMTDDPCYTYDWFRALETQQSHNSSLRYLAVFDEDRLVAVAPCSIESVRLRTFVTTPFPKVLDQIGVKMRTLCCLSPLSMRSKVLLVKNLDGRPILGLLAKKVDEICRKQKIMFSYFPFVSQFDRLLMENLQNHGYIKRRTYTAFYLDVQWRSFQDYLGSLKPKVASNVRREIKKCIENRITIEESKEKNLATKLSELYSNLSLKYKNRENAYDADFFSKINEHARARTKLFVAKKNNEIVGFSLTLWQKEILDVMIVGFNYDVQTKTDFTYFNLAYYAPIQWAIEHGVRKVYYRTLAEQAKLARGCKQEKTYFFVKYHNQPLRVVTTKVLHPFYDRVVLALLPEAVKRKLSL